MHKFHGVIFVRRGNYRDGTFRFTMVLPDGYSGINTHPQITFVPPIFNPLIDRETGKLDISVDPAMRTWQPDKHFILNALTFLKSIFYLKSFDLFTPVADNTALAQRCALGANPVRFDRCPPSTPFRGGGERRRVEAQ